MHHSDSVPEGEDRDPVGADLDQLDPEALFAALAQKHSLLAAAESTMGSNLWNYTMAVVELCASVSDLYSTDADHTIAAQNIRAVLVR